MAKDVNETTPGEPSSSACSTCFEPIHPKARKCRACDSDQDFRRHFQMGSTVLALLVALLSVTALSIPVIKEAAAPRDSRIRLFFQGFDQNRAFVLATNGGDRPGSVNSVVLATRRGPGSRAFVEIPFAPQVVGPGEAKQIIINLAGPPRQFIDRHGFEKLDHPIYHPFVFQFSYRNFSSEQAQVAPVEVVDLEGAIRSGGSDWHSCAAQTVDYIQRTPNWKTVFPSAAGDMADCDGAPPYMERLVTRAKAREGRQ